MRSFGDRLCGDLCLPIDLFLARGAQFTQKQIAAMLSRTQRKLFRIRIALKVHQFQIISHPTWKDVDSDNIDHLLRFGLAGKRLRIFLVKQDMVYGHGSWTYDPLEEVEGSDHYQGAIFITEEWNENSDEIYQDRGYLGSNDTLLHELGHVLMQEADHVSGKSANFFHEEACKSNDVMTEEQIQRMRSSKYLVKLSGTLYQ